jgi:glucuronoarabinoxylan endo-1,4-beta-xylanase
MSDDCLMRRMATIVLTLWLTSCSSSPQPVTVDFSDLKQSIDGFGASAADLSDHTIKIMSPEQADLFFSPMKGIGLSILRLPLYINFADGLPYNQGVFDFYNQVKLAGERGAKVMASFFSAPAGYKTNESVSNGGHLLTAEYDAWAKTMADFSADLYAHTGHHLFALSIQNESDFAAPYASMLYTTAEMTAFIKVLGPKLASLDPRPKLMAPEVMTWSNASGFFSHILSDPAAAPYLDLIAVHQYGGVALSTTAARPVWQTEMSGIRDKWDPTITHALTVAQWIHDALTAGNASAWLYWWLVGQAHDNQGLIGWDGDVPGPPTMTKRLYTLGNYSKFVRPGWKRVGVLGAPARLSITAFRNIDRRAFAIVVVNGSRSDSTLTVNLSGLPAATSVVPWITSASENLAAHGEVPVTNRSFTFTLSKKTVTTFVGNIEDSPPSGATR